jgi:hypothetical protein
VEARSFSTCSTAALAAVVPAVCGVVARSKFTNVVSRCQKDLRSTRHLDQPVKQSFANLGSVKVAQRCDVFRLLELDLACTLHNGTAKACRGGAWEELLHSSYNICSSR